MSDIQDTPVNPAPAVVDTPAPVDPALVAVDPAPVEASPYGDWSNIRQKYAGGDEKKLKKLERYGSLPAAIDALFAANDKISKGIPEPLKGNETPEQVAAWREQNGIPLTPDGYDLNLPNGLVIGESDKPLVDEFLKVAHDGNWSPNEVKRALSWYMERQAGSAEAQQARDMERRMQTEDALREEYGPSYRQEVKRAFDLLKTAPDGVADQLLGGRLADGTLIGDSPEMIRWLNKIQRELNPIATVVPGSGSNAMQAVETEIASLRKMMGDRTSDYWRGPNAQKNQARYRELVGAVGKAKAA